MGLRWMYPYKNIRLLSGTSSCAGESSLDGNVSGLEVGYDYRDDGDDLELETPR